MLWPVFETFEHTADIGIRIRAGDLATLFAEAARGMFSLIAADLDAVEPAEEMHFRIDGPDPAYLLFDWLNELLYTFDTQHLVFVEFDVRVDSPPVRGLTATARGSKLDPDRHKPDHEIKAITYHGLKLERVAGGWLAEVVLDV